MREYRLITANPDVVKRLMKQPMRGYGWEIRVETDESGQVAAADELLILMPEGDELGRFRLSGGPKVYREIREVVEEDVAMASLVEELERPPLICVRKMPTGAVAMTLWLSGIEMRPLPGKRGADQSRMIQRGPKALDELTLAIQEWKAAHPGALFDSEVPLIDLEEDDGPEEPLVFPPVIQPSMDSDPGQEAAQEPVPAADEGEFLLEIPINKIHHFPGGNIREQYRGLDELAASIKAQGVVQPLTVNAIDGRYVLVIGERRLRAAGLAGRKTVPCRVIRVSEAEALEIMTVENIQREDMTPIEEARAYQRLLSVPGATQGTVAQRVGKAREYINEMLQLLELPKILSDLVANGVLSKRVGLEFIRQTRDIAPDVRYRIAQSVASMRPSAREIRDLLNTLLAIEGVARTTPAATPDPPEVTPAPTAPAVPQARLVDEPQIPERPTQVGLLASGSAVPESARPGEASAPAPDSCDSHDAPPAHLVDEPQTPERPTPSVSSEAGSPVQVPAVPEPALSGEASALASASSDSQAERARSLAEIGRRFWDTGPGDPWGMYNFGRYQDVMFARECYLPLERVLKHWGLRQEIGANSIPRTMGSDCRINIPEQKIWIKGYEQFSATTQIQLEGQRLLIKLPTGGVEVAYRGQLVYYRIELRKQDQGGNKALEQQLVIQDGDRHIVITGGGSAMIRKDLVPLLGDLVNDLPGLPE